MNERVLNIFNDLQKVSNNIKMSFKRDNICDSYCFYINDDFEIFITIYSEDYTTVSLGSHKAMELTEEEGQLLNSFCRGIDFVRDHNLQYTVGKTFYIENDSIIKKYNCFIDDDYLIDLFESKGIELEIPNEYEEMSFTEKLENYDYIVRLLTDHFYKNELSKCYN